MLAAAMALTLASGMAQAQEDNDDDIWREAKIGEVDFGKTKNYCQRIYGYYRYVDDGEEMVRETKDKLFYAYEGICELDVRYDRKADEGALVIVGRNLVHPDQKGRFMDFYELTPYTFLEKARRDPRHFTLQQHGDTTLVSTRLGLSGTVVRDRRNRELRMDYNAIAPDTVQSMNIVIARARLWDVNAKAVYRIDDDDTDYVPQGQLKHITFEGNMVINIGLSNNNETTYRERTELYVDSVVYMTRDEYRADKKRKKEVRRKESGYTTADIDRLKKKLGVPPLSAKVLQQIEEQRDWEEQKELWQKVRK